MKKRTRKRRITSSKFRSKLEQKASLLLGEEWEYEPYTIPFTMRRLYKTDFCKGDIMIEVKGFFRPGDQAKYLAVRDSLEDGKELVFVFANPDKKVRKGAKSTMADWCERHGFRYYGINELNRRM